MKRIWNAIAGAVRSFFSGLCLFAPLAPTDDDAADGVFSPRWTPEQWDQKLEELKPNAGNGRAPFVDHCVICDAEGDSERGGVLLKSGNWVCSDCMEGRPQ